MAFNFRVEDATGRAHAVVRLSSRDRFYVLDGDGLAPVSDQIAWCFNCSSFVAAERLPSLVEIDRQVLSKRAELAREVESWSRSSPGSSDQQMFARSKQFREEELTNWERLRGWHTTRHSPPRCLACGSTWL